MNNRASKAKPNQTSCIAIQGSFDHLEMVEIGKKHKISKRTACALERFTTDNCYHLDQTIAALLTTVSRSSVVSIFEQPKFSDFAQVLRATEKALFKIIN